MLIKNRVPKTVQWLIKLFVIYLLLFTLFRVATVVFFKPASTPLLDLIPAFSLGLKYDLRWISFLLFPIVTASFYASFSPFYSEWSKKFWTYYLSILTLFILFIYGADFGQFAYVNARLNADALIFAEDPRESIEMIWQSYPIVWIIIGLIGAVLMMVWMFQKIHVDIAFNNAEVHKFSYKKRWRILCLMLLGWFMYGFCTLQPLNFFRAFSLNDEFESNLALNPLQNFFTTLRFRAPEYNTQAKKYYATIANFLQMEGADRKQGNYKRIIHPDTEVLESQPNVVLVICESFSMYKSSMSGNALNSTPFFNQLTQQGIFFNRCFSPSFGTARGVFATITGIPDVQLGKFSTRNEASVNQRTIINDFEGYDKFYFIGGRSQFNNFSGLIHNIKDVKVYEEGSYRSPKVNVWGISDKDLFLEANQVISKQQKPFFAIIQTADNHRPFNIPSADSDFIRKMIPTELLNANGFESQEEYNAFAYTDYCFQKFMEAAQKENYFSNTVFVFVGDHGVEGNASSVYPSAWAEQRLSEEHVPLLFYAPSLLSPRLHEEPVSQIDVLPTIAGLMQPSYVNSTLGRNILDPSVDQHAAFTIYHAAGWIGLVTDYYYYRKNIRINKEEFVPIRQQLPALSAKQIDSIRKASSQLTEGIYETAKWMLLHNQNKP